MSSKLKVICFVIALCCVSIFASTAGFGFVPQDAFSSSGVAASVFSQLGNTGMWVSQAQSSFTSGSSHVLIAYIEGGINLHDTSFTRQIDPSLYINWHELPVPCAGSSLATAYMLKNNQRVPCSSYYSNNPNDYNIDGSGVINALQYANDPRVKDVNGNGVIDPEDLIAAFSNNVNNDHDGFPNDIFGWDFYENQNDPETQDGAYGHANGQMGVIHTVCPACMIVPIRAGDEALDATNNLAQAWRYACMIGANIIVSVTADLGYSTAMEDSINYCHQKGVLMFESSNDFDTPDHQGGMEWNYVVPGNGAVSNVTGLTSSEASTFPTRHWVRSDLTSWGPHNILTALTQGGSTSESTPTLGGVAGLLWSWADIAYQKGLIPRPLDGDQILNLLIDSATRVTDPSLGWPGSLGSWNPQYGYGVPNVYLAMELVSEDKIPPSANITSPRWYDLVKPSFGGSVPIYGEIQPGSSPNYTWNLEVGIGQSPSNWITISSGSGSSYYKGKLGVLNLSLIPPSFYNASFSQSSDKELSTFDQYDVTLRLSVVSQDNLTSQNRRVIYAFNDPSLASNFPLYFGTSSESEPALVDLNGSGVLDIVFADANGYIHAIDPATAKELPGWPVHTDPLVGQGGFKNLNLGYQPIIAPVAVGSLYQNGQEDVIATSLTGEVYAFSPDGTLLPGWPQVLDNGISPPPIPRPDLPYYREPIQMAVAPPVLYPLGGSNELDIIQAGGDGFIHIFLPNGQNYPGWPIKVNLPANFTIPSGYSLINDQRLISPATVAYLNGYSNPPDIVVRPQYSLIRGSGIQPLAYGEVFAYNLSGRLLPNFPVSVPGLFEFYGSAMDALTEGTFSPLAYPVLGNGADQIIDAPVFSPAEVISSNGSLLGIYGNGQLLIQDLFSIFTNPINADNPSSWPQNEPLPFASNAAIGKLGGNMVLSLNGVGATSFAAAELVPSSSNAIIDFSTAYLLNSPNQVSQNSSDELPNFPQPRQGYDILGASIFAPVSSSDNSDLIEAGDSGSVVAFNSSGQIVPGFPKFTGSWIIGSPAAGDLFSNGKVDVVATTRDGYLFVWNTSGSENSNDQWWRTNGNEYNSNRYGAGTRPPGAVTEVSWDPNANLISFKVPGNIWYSGTPKEIQVTFHPSNQVVTIYPSSFFQGYASVSIPLNQVSATIQAVSTDNLVGKPIVVVDPATWF